MKSLCRSVLLGGTAMLVVTAAAQADTINFTQWGGPGTALSSPLTGFTQDGVGVTLTGPGSGYTIYEQTPTGAHTQPYTWYGVFNNGDSILFDNATPGAVTMTFTKPIASLTVAAQANLFGLYTQTEQAYNGATLVATDSATNTNPGPSTVNFLTVSAASGFTKVLVSVTNDGAGMALYGGSGNFAVPEPASAAVLFGALGALGVLRRRSAPSDGVPTKRRRSLRSFGAWRRRKRPA
jgi:hypothetical protein